MASAIPYYGFVWFLYSTTGPENTGTKWIKMVETDIHSRSKKARRTRQRMTLLCRYRDLLTLGCFLLGMLDHAWSRSFHALVKFAPGTIECSKWWYAGDMHYQFYATLSGWLLLVISYSPAMSGHT
jgi:hypothetical protein